MAVFAGQYINTVIHLVRDMGGHVSAPPNNPFLILDYFFSPVLIVSLLALGLFSLLYRILGIVFVAKNKNIEGGEQALWIIGFVFIGFITAIIFMALAKSKKMIAEEPSKPPQDVVY